ncbi:hypothetical protein BXU09_19170 [Deinococcus sp. LM3]|nr:hypothetical protein BXU09_19170 [Deinococcus sp. LM3]
MTKRQGQCGRSDQEDVKGIRLKGTHGLAHFRLDVIHRRLHLLRIHDGPVQLHVQHTPCIRKPKVVTTA